MRTIIEDITARTNEAGYTPNYDQPSGPVYRGDEMVWATKERIRKREEVAREKKNKNAWQLGRIEVEMKESRLETL